nr:Uncharacterised protein [Klebsiella pneumoniae]
MSEAFRDISPEAPELQPIISGLFAEYAARYGDYFSRDAEVELSEWYVPPQGCLLSLSVRAKLSPPARISRRIATPRRSNVSGRTAVCDSRAGGEGGPELERRAVLAGYSHIYLTTGFRQPEAVKLYLSQGMRRSLTSRETRKSTVSRRTMAGCGSLKRWR